MEETDLHKPSQEDIFVDEASKEDEDTQQRGAPRKVWFGLIVLLAIASVAGVLLSKGNDGSQLSDIELLANVVMPGVDISDLHRTAPQYRALEWLVYNDARNMTIADDATELLERFSLVTFCYSTGGEDLTCAPWLNSSSHCDWDAFDCDEDGRVTALHLEHSNMHGTLPTEIGNLKRLRYLDVGFNKLVGTIPSEIGNMQQLALLDLFGNSCTGTIPSEIGQMQQLVDLYLSINNFSGPIPSEIGNLQQLNSLFLPNNDFSGIIPSEIGNMQQLKALILSGNIGLTGTMPVEVGQLESINQARFEGISLMGGLDDGAFCKNRHENGFSLWADCGGLNPKITCECCNQCCGIDENGRNECDSV